jgi:hypothetical protein
MARKQASEKPLVISTGAAPSRHKPARATRKKTSEPQTETSPVSSVEADELETETPVMATGTVIVMEEVTIGYEPATDEIAQLAYLYWEARGCKGGSPEEDWLRAEQELRSRATAVATA